MDPIDKPVSSENAVMAWASDAAAELLRRMGIKYVALNPGSSYRAVHDSLVNYLGNREPELLLCLHEDSVISIAHGYAKAAGEPMACVVHANVGLMHALMGLYNAWCDRVPILLIGSTGPVDPANRVPWIDWIHTAKDQGALLRNFVKYDDEPRSPAGLVEGMLRAARTMRTKPNGPVYLCLDKGLQETKLPEGFELPAIERFAPADPPCASPAALEKAAGWLVEAKSPVILIGRVSRQQGDWDARVKLAELLGAGAVTDMKLGAVFPTDHPLHVEPPGVFLGDRQRAAIRDADVILDLDWMDLGGALKQSFGSKDKAAGKVIHCSLDSYLHNGWSNDHYALPPADLPVLADPDAFVAALLPLLERRLKGKSRAKSKPVERKSPRLADRDPDAPVTALDISLALNEARGDRKLTIAKLSLGWDAAGYPFREPMDYLGYEGGAGLGSTPGIAVGAGLALKGSGRIAVANIGDGDFLQGCTALWTAAHYEIPVLFIISNNRSNFNDEIHQQNIATIRGRQTGNRWIGMRMEKPAIDLCAIARAQGAEAGEPVEKAGDLLPALRKGLDAVARGKVYLVDVHIAPGAGTNVVSRAGKAG